MKKIIYSGLSAFLIFLLIIITVSASNTIAQCQNNCSKNYNQEIKDLSINLNNCINITKQNYNCSSIKTYDKNICIRSQNNDIKNCNDLNKALITQRKNDLSNCNKICTFINKNISCENGTYKAGDYFLDACNICQCNFNGKIQCKRSSFCNFNDFSISNQECTSNNGFFQQVCAGDTYSKQCSRDSFCQCDGTNNYTCPKNYSCIKDFVIDNIKRSYASLGWIKLTGQALGNTGICTKDLNLSTCGDNICENKCINTNCNNAETKYNCPIDCK